MTRRVAASLVLSAAGLALLLHQVQTQGGLAAVRSGLASVGIGFAPILVLAFVRFALRGYAWATLLGSQAPARATIAATISGDALGNVIPLAGLMASEPAKAMYLSRYVRPSDALAALTAENFFYSVSVAFYVVVAAAAMLMTFDVPPIVRTTGLITLAGAAALVPSAGWLAWQRPAMLSGLLARLPFAKLHTWVAHVRDFERRTYLSATHEDARLGNVACLELLFHISSFGEAYLTLWLLTGRSLPLEALVLDGLNRVVNVVFKMIWFRVGVDEVTSTTLAAAIGLGPEVGLVMALVRKIRMFVWAAVGLALWAGNSKQTTRPS